MLLNTRSSFTSKLCLLLVFLLQFYNASAFSTGYSSLLNTRLLKKPNLEDKHQHLSTIFYARSFLDTQSRTYLSSKLHVSSSAKEGRTESSLPSVTSPVLSTIYLVTMDVVLRKLFKKASIAFPSSLAGCGTLFASLLLLNKVNPKLGEKSYDTLSPGAGVLAKWLPVFFVPSLVTLPLAPSMGSAAEVCVL